LSFTPVTVAVASSVPAPSVLGSSVLLAGFGALGLVARRKARLA
jgi:ABC-type Co2+ transport system permease subunit